MTTMSVRPEDILSDKDNTVSINGLNVRKGTIAAFLANVDILENPQLPLEQKQAALSIMQELAPAVVAIGLHKHVIFKNQQAEAILKEAQQSLNK